MKIDYQKLTIQNFKGVLGERTIEFTGQLTQILGANHTGKTTTADAVQWLLFGKNSEDSSVFGISPKDEEGNIIPNLENRVTLEMTADGKPLVLEKVRKEVRTKPKNGDEEKLSYPCSYFINGQKYTEKDFKAEIDSLVKEALFKTLTNPAYFPGLKAESQRLLLTKMVGEPSIADIANRKDEFKQLLHQMQGTDLQRYREHLAYQIKELKKELEQIPSRLSEQENELAPLKEAGHDFAQIEADIKAIDEEIAKCDDELADNSRIIDRDFEARSKERNEIGQMRTRMQDIRGNYIILNQKARQAKAKATQDAQDMVTSAKRKQTRNQQDIDDATRDLQRVEIDMKEFRTKWAEVEAQQFAWDNSQETCPTCGQRLPQGDIDRMRAEAEERFNTRKAKQQDALDEEAKVLKKRKADAEAKLRKANDNASEIEKELAHAQELLDGELATGAEEQSHTDDEEWQRLDEEVRRRSEALENASSEVTVQADTASNEIKQRKAGLVRERDQKRDTLAIRTTIDTKEKRIAQLEEQLRNLNQQLSDLQKQDYTAEQLTQAYIEELETRVNMLFTNVQFRMFKRLLNGNLEPICECTMHGTPYQDLSNSEKINAGLDIINAISEDQQTWVPVFIDNAEAVNDVTPTDSQQILLIVSRDKQLTVIK